MAARSGSQAGTLAFVGFAMALTLAVVILVSSLGRASHRSRDLLSAEKVEAMSTPALETGRSEPRPLTNNLSTLLGEAPKPEGAPAPTIPPGSSGPTTDDPGQRPASPLAERDQLLEKLRHSGVASGSWTTEAVAVFDQWRRDSPAASSVDISRADCFAAGCAVTMTYRDMPAFQDSSRDFQDSAQFKSWTGPKFRSAPLSQDSGAVQATWIMFR